MEEKLFWIGILMGIYLFLTHRFREKGKFEAEFARAWHAVFAFLFFFSAAAMLMVTLDNNYGRVVTATLFSLKQIAAGIIAGGAAAAYSYFRWGKGRLGEKKAREKLIKYDMEWSETVFSAVILASVVMYLFVQAFKIPSGSMRETFMEGDHLFVNKIVYGVRIPYTRKKMLDFGEIEKGDIVIFRFPIDDPNEFQCGGYQYGKDFIKRVIALPGDEVEIRQGRVIVNGETLMEDYAQYVDGFRRPEPVDLGLPKRKIQRYWEKRMLGQMLGEYVRDNFGPVKVPPGYYFVMGDNRDRSCDSRYWGPVPEYRIKGKAWFIYWPPDRMGVPR